MLFSVFERETDVFVSFILGLSISMLYFTIMNDSLALVLCA